MARPTVVALVAAAAVAGVLLAAACGAVGRTTEGEVSRGKELFTEKCGSCHTLADAGTQSDIGPDLDEAFDDPVREGFDESTIRDVVRNQIAYPVTNPVTEDAPGMPPQDELFPECDEGEDPEETGCFEDPDEAADAVAAYVASVAGRPVEGGPAPGGIAGGSTDGEQIFSAAGCGSCHVLQAAGSTGTIGPDLDATRPSLELAIDRITNGAPPMPAFEGRLTEEQIRAVAEFVSSSAGR
jgi:mono/diheme cytochrome c family protein